MVAVAAVVEEEDHVNRRKTRPGSTMLVLPELEMIPQPLSNSQITQRAYMTTKPKNSNTGRDNSSCCLLMSTGNRRFLCVRMYTSS